MVSLPAWPWARGRSGFWAALQRTGIFPVTRTQRFAGPIRDLRIYANWWPRSLIRGGEKATFREDRDILQSAQEEMRAGGWRLPNKAGQNVSLYSLADGVKIEGRPKRCVLTKTALAIGTGKACRTRTHPNAAPPQIW